MSLIPLFVKCRTTVLHIELLEGQRGNIEKASGKIFCTEETWICVYDKINMLALKLLSCMSRIQH